MDNLLIVGTGINARKAYEFVKMYNLFNIIGFAVNGAYYKEEVYCSLPVYRLEEVKQKLNFQFKVFVALYWNRLNKDRKTLFDFCKKERFEFANLISPNSVIYNSAKIGVNCWIQEFACINNDAIIGDNVIIMPYSLIGSKSIIEPHCFIGVKTIIGGESLVRNQTFTGFNAIILDNTIIEEKCIIGAGTVIKRNLPPYSRCITNSDNQIFQQYPENEIESKLIFYKNVR